PATRPASPATGSSKRNATDPLPHRVVTLFRAGAAGALGDGMNFMGLFAALVLIALVVWAVPKILAAIKIPENVATVIYVGLVCLVVLWLLSTFFGGVPGLRLR